MKKLIPLLLLMTMFSSLSISAAQTNAPDPAQYQLNEVISGFSRPIDLVHAGDDRLFIVEQGGIIKVLHDGLVTEFLDVSALVTGASEQGLLGMAFHPDYATNGYFFINYTDLGGDTVIARYQVSANPDVADPNSATEVLSIEQPYRNHNGGDLVFGADGNLYIGTGDGGSGGDPQNRAQNKQELLGKMLRINVDQLPYSVPADNPFVGDNTYLPEIWALGLRNPWRYSVDRTTGDFYIADVGQGNWEEVNFQAAGVGGQNYGWNIYEGKHNYKAGSIPGAVAPILEYSHDSGCSVTGGYVYRGVTLPDLFGVYLYGDFCSGTVWSAVQNESGIWQSSLFTSTDFRISSFGEDAAGELYLLDYSGRLIKIESSSIPNRNYTNDTTPTLTWDGTTYATRYEVQIANNPAFTGASAALYMIDPPALTFDVPAPLPIGNHYWRVRAYNGTAASSWSAIQSITVNPS